MSQPVRKFVPLNMARPFILDADLLAFRGTTWLARLIKRGGRGEHSHVGMAAWWHGEPMCCESRELKGARAVTLETQVNRYPGMIDVYRANSFNRWPHFDPVGAARAMIKLTGSDYGYQSVLSAAMVHLPGVRFFTLPSLDDELEDKRPPFCSQAVAWANRTGGGVDVRPNLADRFTEPSDLVGTSFYHCYICTLVPDDFAMRSWADAWQAAELNHEASLVGAT